MRRFAVRGTQPKAVNQELLDALAEHLLSPAADVAPPEVDYGWCGGRHVLDRRFDFDRNVFNDAISFALRVDTNCMPAELRQAYKLMEEDAVAAGNPSGFISKRQKTEAKQTLERRMEEELRSGKFRRSRLAPVLWDLPGQRVYSPAGGAAAEKLMELFQRTFGLELHPLTAGGLALQRLEASKRRRDYEDFRPTRFVPGPEGDSQYPHYPWTAKGPQPKDFLGNEFLLWLWHESERGPGPVATESHPATIFIDRSLDLDCAYGLTGRDGLRGTGPGRMPEARDGLRSGKVPRKAGLVLDASGQQFNFTFHAENFSLFSTKLPEVEEAETPRTLFEERVTLLRDLWQAMDRLFDAFLKLRASSHWESQTGAIRKWIMKSSKLVAAVA